MTAAAILAMAGAVLLIRLGWGGRRGLAAAGWALAAAALGWLTWADGAWGLATGLTAGSIFALLAVAQAGVVSPARTPRRAAAVTATAAPMGAVPSDLARRIAVFLLVVPVSFLAALWLALAINAAMKGGAPLEANSVATLLFVQPTAWAALMAWQMVQPRPARMVFQPALVAAAGLLIWMMT
ncbi:MAG: hypothetical protein JNJ92_02395 [Altererythrobacter sp.]|nr:hypothetical protein [Altererythrobacter sp.]